MARKWSDFFRALHTILSRKRWQRLGFILLLGWAIALAGPILWRFPVQAQANPVALVEQGQQQFEAGQYPAAVTSLETAIAAFDPQTQSLQQAITFSNLALVYQASGDWDAAESALQNCFSLLDVTPNAIATDTLPTLSTEKLRILASALNVYGKGLLQKGNPDRALTVWQQTERAYTAVGDREGQLTSQTNQLQALQSLGRFQQADALAGTIQEIINAQPNSTVKAKGLLNLGNIKRAMGQLGPSQATLKEALAIAQTLDQPALTSTLQLSLGTTYHALGNRDKERLVSINRQGIPLWICSLQDLPDTLSPENYQTALDYYQAAAGHAPNQVAANLNTLAVFQARNQLATETAWQTWRSIEQQLPAMRPSRAQVYAHIALAKQGACLNLSRRRVQDSGAIAPATEDAILPQTIQSLLETAIAIAQDLDDSVAASYALGNLGSWYEVVTTLYSQAADNVLSEKSFNSDLLGRQTARELTEQALFLAQPSDLPDIAFQWQWQLGRLDEAEGKEADAIVHYQQAAKTLDSVRGNLLTIDSDVQFSFRDNVEPLYRELVDLLLRPENPSPEVLEEAVQSIDTLQLAELENFLQCSLSVAQLDQEFIDETAATLYGIVLKNRVELILRIPDESPQGYKLDRKRYNISQKDLEADLVSLQAKLPDPTQRKAVENLTQEIYNGIIRPFKEALETDLDFEESHIKTLALVLDGALRNLPFSMLYDGERYLVERYATVVVPSLKLLEPEPLSRNISLFVGGVSESVEHPISRNSLPILANVTEEINAIKNIFPNNVLLIEELTKKQLTENLKQQTFQVVHIAAHGEFSSDPERTFILLKEEALYARELDNLLRIQNTTEDSVKMLVLSACTTAAGDKRAALGLAGLTVRSGSRSTLAALFEVEDDAAPPLMQHFYQSLRDDPELSKAEALRQAQIKLLDDPTLRRPVYWAPFILVGNWL
ncbi:MAG: CHAT domain-containing protein [Leptolyngbyaceae cyanobacterium]